MKKIVFLFLLAPFFTKAQQPSAEALTKEFINSMQQNDADKYVNLFPKLTLLNEMMTASMKDEDAEKKESMKSFLASQTDSSFALEMKAEFERDYNKIKKVVKNPSTIVFNNTVITPTQSNDEMFSKIGKAYDAVIFVTSQGKKYKLTLTEIVDYKSSFYGFNLKKVELIGATATTTVKKIPPKKPVKKS